MVWFWLLFLWPSPWDSARWILWQRYPCRSAPAHLISPCWLCDRTGMMAWGCSGLNNYSVVASVWDASWRGPTFPTAQDLVSSALCIFTRDVPSGERRLGHCVTIAGATGTPQDNTGWGKPLSVSHSYAWQLTYLQGEKHTTATYIIKIKQKQRNVLLGLQCFGCHFVSAMWLLRLWTLSEQKIYA